MSSMVKPKKSSPTVKSNPSYLKKGQPPAMPNEATTVVGISSLDLATELVALTEVTKLVTLEHEKTEFEDTVKMVGIKSC